MQRASSSRTRLPFRLQGYLEHVQHGGELAEQQRPPPLRTQRRQQRLQPLQLGGAEELLVRQCVRPQLRDGGASLAM
jgi:hypothetical protein